MFHLGSMSKLEKPTQRSEANREVHTILDNTAAKLSKRHKICPIGITIHMPFELRKLGLSFEVLGPLTPEELRPILVDCTRELVHAVNSNEVLRPNLKVYPFTPNQIEITLFMVDRHHRSFMPPQISSAGLRSGTIDYTSSDPNQGMCGMTTQVEEDYATALQLVGGSEAELAEARAMLQESDRAVAARTRAEALLNRVSTTLAQRYQMQVHPPEQSVGVRDEQVTSVYAAFHIQGSRPKAELRRIALDANQEFANAINADPELKPYLKEVPFPRDRVDVKISMLDQAGRHVMPPNIAVVTCDGRRAFFSQSEWGLSDQEPYDTAVKIVQKDQV